MAFGLLNDIAITQKNYKCLSADTKPTTNIEGGSLCYETDTLDLYEFDGAAWILIRTTASSGNPAANVIAEVTSAPKGPYWQEQGPFTLEQCLNAGTHNLGANGAIGDFLHRVFFPRAPQGTKAGVVYIRDGGVIVTQFEFGPVAAAGAAGEGVQAGTSIEINAVSQIGTWAVQIVDNNSMAEVIAVGRFTD